MLFNSIEFALFFPIVFLLYWLVFNRSLKIQNAFIIATSYFFYAWWDWRFLGLILLSSSTDFIVAQRLADTDSKFQRKALLYTSLAVNLGILAYFKYCNFFIDNFNSAFTFFGNDFKWAHLNLVLPVGISYYTFQTIGYTLDVYWKKIKPEKNLITFFAFVSFFPQLLAGPIERARTLMPQFNNPRTINYEEAKDAIREILWGLFLKCAIADQASVYVNDIYTNYANYPAGTIFLGMLYFGIQVYGDFAGYSSMAIGFSKLLGINIMRNFAFPYTSSSFSEVWRRWHISLMTWFRDYVYAPLGGAKKGKFRAILNIYIVFALSGLWHGPNWTFALWGVFVATLITVDIFKNMFGWQYILDFKFLDGPFKFLRRPVQIFYLLTISSLAAAFFRANSVGQSFNMLYRLFDKSIIDTTSKHTGYLWVVIFILVWEHWMRHRKSRHGLQIGDLNRYLRWSIYAAFTICFCYSYNIGQEYIYFNF